MLLERDTGKRRLPFSQRRSGGEAGGYLAHVDRGGDFVSGRGAADNLDGQNGDDRVLGGPGDDWVKGGKQDDVVKGDLGNDRITGGSGHNVIRAGDGMRDLIVCGDNSRNLIFYNPRLDRFRNCVFERGLKETADREASSVASVVALGP